MKGIIINILKIFAVVLLTAVAAFVIWAEFLVPVMDEADAALVSDAEVTVTEGDFLAFETDGSTVGLIYYPGGRVEREAYGPFAKALAEAGINVYLPSFPLDLAVFGIDKAEGILDANPQITEWYIGGHSLGGVMASEYYKSNPDAFEGLVFYASYPNSDLSSIPGNYGVLYGSEDGLCLTEDVDGAKDKLPAQAQYHLIQGANHSQFGYYGFQKGDGQASLSYQEQKMALVNLTLKVILGSD